jgi:hypothetical protein
VQLEQVEWWSSALSTALSASCTIASGASRNDSRLRHGMLRSAEQREGEEREAQHDVTRRHVISWALDLAHKNTDSGFAMSPMSNSEVFLYRVHAWLSNAENEIAIRLKSATSRLLLCQPSLNTTSVKRTPSAVSSISRWYIHL